MADELRKAGYTVTGHVGKYADGTAAFGIVGNAEEGPGPTVLVRTELDALPVEEKTGLPYASKIAAKRGGQGRSHARLRSRPAHDVASGRGAHAGQLKDRWRGTLMLSDSHPRRPSTARAPCWPTACTSDSAGPIMPSRSMTLL